MKSLKTLMAIVPGPLIGWVNQWAGIFGRTGVVANPVWQHSADLTAASIATVMAVSLWAILRQKNKGTIDVLILFGLSATVILFGACVIFHFYLDKPHSRDLSESLIHTWFGIYVIMIQMAIGTVTLAAIRIQPR
jgi:hypothetical protein